MRYTIALSFLALLCASSTDLSAQVERRPFLFKDSRGELAQARARGESDVLLVIAAQVGQKRTGRERHSAGRWGDPIPVRRRGLYPRSRTHRWG